MSDCCEHPPPESLRSLFCTRCGVFKLDGVVYPMPNTKETLALMLRCVADDKAKGATVVEVVSDPEKEERIHRLIRKTIGETKAEDFRFSVEADGTVWDVYRMRANGIPGTMAVALIDGDPHVGLFERGELEENEIVRAIEEGGERVPERGAP